MSREQAFRIGGRIICGIGVTAMMSTLAINYGSTLGDAVDIAALRYLKILSHRAYELGAIGPLTLGGMASYVAGSLMMATAEVRRPGDSSPAPQPT